MTSLTNTDLPPIRIATRASQLALWQANHVADRIRAISPGTVVELVEVTTSGDRNQSDALRTLGNTGLFTREVQAAVLDQRADLAVHSLKDLPTEGVPGLCLAAVPERAPMFDALVLPQSSNGEPTLAALPPGAKVGTGSPRRQAQLLFVRPDLQLSEVRGNVDTRLRKLDAGEYDALVLAAAGLTRLGLGSRISATFEPPVMYPAVSQGALGLECRADDERVRAVLASLTDPVTFAAVRAERRLLAALRAGCHAPLGVFSQARDQELHLEAVVLRPDGTHRWMAAATGTLQEPEKIGQAVADRLVAQGATAVL